MGNKSSKPEPCFDAVICEPWVEYVAYECEKVGNKLVDKSIMAGLDGLVGTAKAKEMMKIWTNVNNRLNGTGNNKWDITQPDTILVNETGFSDGFTNYEGFQEGAQNKDKCVQDDCATAAYKMIEDCKRLDPAIPNEISNIIKNGTPLLSSNMSKAINPEPVPEPDMSLSKWVTRSFPNLTGQAAPAPKAAPKAAPASKVVLPPGPNPKVVLPPGPNPKALANTKALANPTSASTSTSTSVPASNPVPVTTQNLNSSSNPINGSSVSSSSNSSILGFTNKEGFENENNGLYNFIKVAIQDRHDRFKDTTRFAEDCKNNSFYTMKKFIGEEKAMLDKLHKYYTSFVSSYETLYLNKETVSRTINSKLDELEKIQSKIDSYKTNLHVDNRKNNYQNDNYIFYSSLKFYMLIIYYSLFILYLIFSEFISEKQYNNKKVVLILVLYLIIPILLSYSVNIAYEGYIFFLEYYNIKEDTKSYVDIVKGK
jgi:hypothetical protein